jgi:hypothetical protein
MKKSENIQHDLENLGKSGTDIRDRGAFIDALDGMADFFVTSDAKMSKNAPAGKIAAKYGL